MHTSDLLVQRAQATMLQTGENVATQYNVSREDHDALALRSQRRTITAEHKGFFAGEIVAGRSPTRKRGEFVEFSVDLRMCLIRSLDCSQDFTRKWIYE